VARLGFGIGRQDDSVGDFSSYQKRVLLVLTLINFVNWIDRQIVYPLFPMIQREFRVSYAELGWLVATFSLVHALGSLGLGRLADMTSHKKVISGGIFFWSGATFLSGIAGTFGSLLVARGLVGVGEAAYMPAASSIISAEFSERIRAWVQGIFNLGMFIGGALGLALGSVLAESVGWRSAFFIVGVPGFILALAVLRLPNSPQARVETAAPMFSLLRSPEYLLILVGGWFISFAGYGYVIWGIDFVYKYKGFGLREAGISMGIITLVAGSLGVMAGAAVADRLAAKWYGGRALAPAIGFLLSAPFIVEGLATRHKPSVLASLAVGTFLMTWYHGPVTAVTHDVTPRSAHATAVGMYFFVVNLFATTAASLLIGRIADRYGLPAGMHCAVVSQVAGGVCFLLLVWLIRQRRRSHNYGYGATLVSVAEANVSGTTAPEPKTLGA
jgi:MFS transporter, Spinster family, sphingosine-1-phosphate transporter